MDRNETLLSLVNEKLDLVILRLEGIERKEERMSAQLDRLRQQVERATTVSQSAVTLITGLAQQIRDLKDDPAAMEQLANDLDAQTGKLATAVEMNTPAATTP